MVLCKFNLCLGMCRMGIGGKDIKDKARAIKDTTFQSLLHVTGLRGAQLVVNDGNLNVLRLDVLVNLLQLARTEIGHTARSVQWLHKTRHGHTASCLQQESQLVEVFLRTLATLLFTGNGNKHSPLGNLFVCDKISH